MIAINDAEFALLKDYLYTACGIAVPADKRYLFVTRLSEFLGEVGCDSFSQFYLRLTEGDDLKLRSRLVEAMTTNETSFFRDSHPFEALIGQILPELAARRAEEARFVPPRLRIGSVGCSTGEEPYTIAMCVYEWLHNQDRFTRNDVSVLAVDISKAVLDHARRGLYDPRRVDGKLPDGFRSRYFRETRSGLMVHEDVRAMVFFGELNLSESFGHLGSFDLIFCRNVIIYFSTDLKISILDQFHRMLNPGGVLVMGASENLYRLSDKFAAAHAGATTFYRKADRAPHA